MTSNIVAKIAIENTAYSFDKPFDYAVPENLSDKAIAGCRVIVPFGRGNKKRQGIILSIQYSEINNLKTILEVLDNEPVLSEKMLKLAYFMKDHYFCTLYDAVKTMLPTGINYKLNTLYGAINNDYENNIVNPEHKRIYDYLLAHHKAIKSDKIMSDFGLSSTKVLDEMVSKKLVYKTEEAFRKVLDSTMKMVAPVVDADTSNVKLTPKQQNIFDTINSTGGTSVKEICYFTGVTSAVIDALYKKNLVYYYEEEVFRIESRMKNDNITPLILSKEQENVCTSLLSEYKSLKPQISLIFGVTGSGKTSVFISLIERIINDGKGIIVMVPEISLTPQFVSQFSERFGDKIAVFHSALSLGERLDEYKRVKSGKAQIVIGTRSAVFAPFENLGLIIMDEEQEYSYKSENSPRYHAREIAKFRCGQNNGLLILSSATPCVETYHYALTNRYSLHTLTSRYGNATLPKVIVADMNEESQNGNISGYSNVLLESINYNLEQKKQSIILLNRRGYNTFATCKSCGESITCPNCSISLTYHKANNRLMCHYCGYSVPFENECPTCHSHDIRLGGAGTQKTEKDIAEIFPNARVLRMDADATTSKSSYEKIINSFAKGEYDILIGTQMVAKGLNFPNVTLVGVLNADQMLYADDYRSYERSFSLLTQVVGRSGRGMSKGLAVIQSYTPDNLIISMAAKQDYIQFYNTEINVRKSMLYPPFADICLIGFVGQNQTLTLKGANEFLKSFVGLAKKNYPNLPLRILGPTAATIVKVNNKFRYKLIIKCKNNREFRELLSKILIEFGKNKEFSSITAYADMNALIC